MNKISRRKLIYGGVAAAAGVGGLAVADRMAKRYGLIPPDGGGVYGPGETLTYACQRLLTVNKPAREFPRSMISKNPFANAIASRMMQFKRLEAGGFRDWRLVVDGTVAHPLVLSLADLKTLPVHSQITEVACEEGWSYVAEWIGTPLSNVLREAGVLPQTRYIVYHAFEKSLWGSIDMADAWDDHYAADDGHERRSLAGAVWRPIAAAPAATAGLQEPEVRHAHHGDRRHQEVRQGIGFGRSRIWICVVRGNLKGREQGTKGAGQLVSGCAGWVSDARGAGAGDQPFG